MSNRGIIKSYTAEAAIAACRFVKAGSADYQVAQAAAATDKILGVSMPLIAASTGETVDVMRSGIADIQLGGAVTRGDLLTSDANGCAVTAAPGAGANNRIGGTAEISGVSGDTIPMLITPGSVKG